MSYDQLGYKPVFDKAEEVAESVPYETAFPNFRDHPELFHFIMAGQHHRYIPDVESLLAAFGLDNEIYGKLYDKGPSLLGGGPDGIDVIESRHILMLTYLIQQIGTEWGTVLEIGGGYGNFLRLVSGIVYYDSWTIVDLKHISDLQRWFLTQHDVPLDKVDFQYNTNFVPKVRPTLAIGTHSLSEFSHEDFEKYFKTIRTADWFYYVVHNGSPSPVLLDRKMELIQTMFTLYSSKLYESGSSTMYLFKANE